MIITNYKDKDNDSKEGEFYFGAVHEQKASIIFTVNMSLLSPEFTTEKLNVSNNNAKYSVFLCSNLSS
jgi:hypothetical protein